MTLREVGQTFIKDSGESQQAVDLLLQGDAHGANVPLIHVLPLLQLFDDEEVGVWGAVERKTGLGVCHRQIFWFSVRKHRQARIQSKYGLTVCAQTCLIPFAWV